MRNFTFQITPRQATEIAQDIHNDIDENGDINQDSIIEMLVEELSEKINAPFEDWLKENIDWGQLVSDDLAAKEDRKEYWDSQVRGWAG